MYGNMIAGTSLVSEREALDRYRLRERVSRYAFGMLSEPDATVCVSEGNLHIDGHIELEQLGHAGLIVEGDLEVTGSIINAHSLGCNRTPEGDGIPFLLVGGNLRARNVVPGTSQIVVEGDADVAEVLLLHDIDSRLEVKGATRIGIVVDIYNASPGFPLSDHLHPDVPIHYDEDYGVAVETVEEDEVIARIRARLPVLRRPDDSRPLKSYEQWLAECATYGEVLRHAPSALIDPAICLAAVKSYGHAIAHVPRELVTDEMADAALAQNPWALQGVPVEFRTAERCRIAVQHQGRMLAHVPVELRTLELCTLAMERDSRVSEVLPFIPEAVLTPELCLRAVQRNGHMLASVPERFRTFDVCIAAVRESPLFAYEHVPEPLREAVTQELARPRRD